MLTALSDNPAHIRQLCSVLSIGEPQVRPSAVVGGLHHRMWRLETARGIYAVKQLSADTDLSDPETVYRYNSSEAIAEAFAVRGIPAVYAVRRGDDYLQIIDDQGYLVHPWFDGAALDLSQISDMHALAVARILARMHRADIAFAGLEEHEFEMHPEETIVDLVELAAAFGTAHAAALRRELPELLDIVASARVAADVLASHLVISHGDLDQKNVLWSPWGEPALIDWESARRLHPTYEVLLEAFNWSGIGLRFDRALFRAFVAAYKEAGGLVEADAVEASYRRILGDWVYWLMYNVGRSIDQQNEDQRRLGSEQVDFALAALTRLRGQGAEALCIADRRPAGGNGARNRLPG